MFMSAFHEPKEGSVQEKRPEEIYIFDLFFIHYTMNNIHKKNRIYKKFTYFQTNHDNYSLGFKRMVCFDSYE